MNARDLIEPAARRDDLDKREGGFVYDSEAATSIAISLKRIADELCKDGAKPGLSEMLYEISVNTRYIGHGR